VNYSFNRSTHPSVCWLNMDVILPTGKHITTVEESVTLDNGGFTALELNSRHLNVKSSFLKKNGSRCGFI